MVKKYYVLTPNSHVSMNLYNKVRENNIKATMAPTPRSAEHCCGVCILYEDINDSEKIKEIAKEHNLEIDKFWESEEEFKPDRNKFCWEAKKSTIIIL